MNKIEEYEQLTKNVDKKISKMIKETTSKFINNFENNSEFNKNNSKEIIDSISKISLFIQEKLENDFSRFEFDCEETPLEVNGYTKIFYNFISKELENMFNSEQDGYINAIIFERKMALEKILTGKNLDTEENILLK